MEINNKKVNNLYILKCCYKIHKIMKSVSTWNLTNNKLHQFFKNNNELISIKVRGNTWEPITRWLRLDSRVFRQTTNKARITLCDIESLAEIYNYRSIRWKSKKLTPLPTKGLSLIHI